MSTTSSALAPIDETRLTGFYRRTTIPEKRTFWACATGWALDGMDFVSYH
ncbi:hypothetical protein [Bradyrhizobium altum]